MWPVHFSCFVNSAASIPAKSVRVPMSNYYCLDSDSKNGKMAIRKPLRFASPKKIRQIWHSHTKTRKLFAHLLICSFTHFIAHAQKPDTTLYTLQEVKITGTPLSRYAAGSRLTELDSTLLAQNPAASLSEVLQLQLPIYFRNYGQNQLSSVAFRGTSGSQTSVVWNGFSINSSTLGSSDFSVLPASGYTQVAVQHGNSAATWGSGSIGGTVILQSKPLFERGWYGNIRSEISRFGSGDVQLSPFNLGYHAQQMQVGYSRKTLHLAANSWQTVAENNFPYTNTTVFGSPNVRQPNAVFRQWGFTQDTDWKFSSRGLLSARVWYTHSNRQAQPSMLEANLGNYRIDDSWRMMLSGQYTHRLGETTLKTAFFRDALNWNGANSPVLSYQTQLVHEKELSHQWYLKAGAEVQVFSADIAGNYHRSEVRQSYFLLTQWHPVQPLRVSLNLRQTWVTGFDPPFTPYLGVSYVFFQTPMQTLSLKANASKGYRVSTLHDRFWKNTGGATGNPLIEPEESIGYESGLTYILHRSAWTISTEITGYRNNVRNWIQWVPIESIWMPRNVDQVQTQGLETLASLSYQKNHVTLKTTFQYYLNSAISVQTDPVVSKKAKQLAYTPLHMFLVTQQLRNRTWDGSATFSWTSTRYLLAYDPTDNPFAFLKPYALLHIRVGKNLTLKKGLQLYAAFRVQNVLNTPYQTYDTYAMPGRSYTLSIQFNY